jgi:hypothetical protein
MSKKILFLALLVALALPFTALAVTVLTMVTYAVNTTLLIGSGIVVIMWVVTGVLFLTAQGDPGKLKAGKTALLAAIAGTVLMIVATYAMDLVGGAFGI